MFGTIAGLGPWIVIFTYFFGGGNYAQIPKFVYGILFGYFLFFNTFPINMVLQYMGYGKWKEYRYASARVRKRVRARACACMRVVYCLYCVLFVLWCGSFSRVVRYFVLSEPSACLFECFPDSFVLLCRRFALDQHATNSTVPAKQRYGELVYIILSLASKSMLSWLVFGGTFQPNGN